MTPSGARGVWGRRGVWGLSWLAVLAALLLHLTLAWVLWHDRPAPPRRPDEPTALTVRLVPQPHPRRPRPERRPAAPKPPPPPPPSAPHPRPAPPPPVVHRVVPAPPHLHLHRGRLARRSSRGPSAVPGPGLGLAKGGDVRAGKGVGQATESERDFLLGQILPLWHRPPGLVVPPDLMIRLRVLVLPDGSLGPPFSASTPWAPAQAIRDYDALPPGSPWRQAMEGLYLALRLAQPLKLPPALKARAPLAADLDFRMADLQP